MKLRRRWIDSLEGVVKATEHVLVAAPVEIGRGDEVGVQLVAGASDGYQAVGTCPLDLVGVVQLPIVVLALLGAYPVGGGDLVLQAHVGEGEVGEDGVDGGQRPETGEEGEVLALGALLGVVELAVGAVGALLDLGHQPLLPPLGDLVRVLCGGLLVRVPAVSAVVGCAGGGAVVKVEHRVSEGRGRGGG